MSVMKADLILTGGSILTVDKNNSIHEAVAIINNKIAQVGSSEEIKKLQGPETKIIELCGRSVIPGFIESHIHTAVMGVNALAIDCRPSAVDSISDIQEAIFERTKNTPKGEWIRGWGYNDQYLKEQRNPNKWDLDKVAPDHPVMLTRVCNHISAHNSRSIEIANITNTNEYSHETFTRENGEISGVMLEEAHMAMFKAALLKEKEIVDGMVAANEMLLKEGITSIHDSGGYGPIQMRAIQNAVSQKKFKIRLYSMIFSFAENLKFVDSYLNVGIHSGFGDEHFKLGPVKLMIDGSSSGPTAATIEPYAIDPNNYGILSHSQELVDEYILRAQMEDWQITSHAVGDKGITVIVNAIEKAMKQYPREDCRHRIEHCAMVNDELLDRIQKLQIVPICNPIFLYEFGDGYITNYGKERAFKMFTAKSFLDRGIIAAGASDCPITFSNPLMGIHLAVNRTTQGGGEISGVMLEEAHMAMFKAALLKEKEIVDGMVAANEMLLKEGITSIHDSGGYGPIQMRAIQNAVSQKKFKIRLYSMIFSFAENLKFVDSYLNVGIHSGFGDEHFKLGPVKLMIDGSSSGPTAATIEPYAIDPNNYGILSHSQELVDEYILRAQMEDWQITSHAVGDKGITVIVNAIEKAMKQYPREDCRHRIEHCAMVNDELLDRIQKLQIVPICNPIFLYEFGDGYITNYGKERAFKMFTAKSFLDRGIIAAGASDCPITFSNPLMGIHLAVNRTTQGGQVINSDECISPEEALRMFTINGAYASHEDHLKGSIEAGKLADMVILNSDYITTPKDKIWNIKVDTTIIDGKIEYTRTV